MLTLSITAQGFESIAWWHAEVFKLFRIVYETQLSRRNGLDVGRELAASPTFPDRCRFCTAKADDDDSI
jgi:hypothetical protein